MRWLGFKRKIQTHNMHLRLKALNILKALKRNSSTENGGDIMTFQINGNKFRLKESTKNRTMFQHLQLPTQHNKPNPTWFMHCFLHSNSLSRSFHIFICFMFGSWLSFTVFCFSRRPRLKLSCSWIFLLYTSLQKIMYYEWLRICLHCSHCHVWYSSCFSSHGHESLDKQAVSNGYSMCL